MTYLLDVNLLIALIDPDHVHHDVAHDWFAAEGGAAWATCPTTENGAIRIISHPRYAMPFGPGEVGRALTGLCRHPGHVFWADSISLLNPAHVAIGRLHAHRDVTDTYLLALAQANGGTLATLDRRMNVSAAVGARDAIRVL